MLYKYKVLFFERDWWLKYGGEGPGCGMRRTGFQSLTHSLGKSQTLRVSISSFMKLG